MIGLVGTGRARWPSQWDVATICTLYNKICGQSVTFFTFARQQAKSEFGTKAEA
jgi:hypothetical protein